MTVLQNMSLEQAADLVAMRVNVKSAGVLDSIGGAIKGVASKVDIKNPLHAAAIGGGLGLGGGALMSAMSSDELTRKRWLRNALLGGAVGGIGGGLTSVAAGPAGLGGLTKETPREIAGKNAITPPTIIDRASHTIDSGASPILGGAAAGYGVSKGISGVSGNIAAAKARDASVSSALATPKFREQLAKPSKNKGYGGWPTGNPTAPEYISPSKLDRIATSGGTATAERIFGIGNTPGADILSRLTTRAIHGKNSPEYAALPPAVGIKQQLKDLGGSFMDNVRNTGSEYVADSNKPGAVGTAVKKLLHPRRILGRPETSHGGVSLTPQQRKALYAASAANNAKANSKSVVDPKAPASKGRSGVGGALIGAGLGALLHNMSTPNNTAAGNAARNF